MKELLISFILIILAVWLVGINVAAAITVIYDKFLSKKPRGSVMRIPEKSFVRFSMLGGGYGTLFAMFLIWHKTKSHNLLLFKIFLFALLWTVAILAVLKYF
ncbi:MAG: DUF1294 domain-containing protein [Clostridia bacterium]|nr:DUF1294 domain-containing protein [Clostridia bacterium]